jgi:hypothetical protein
MTCDEWLDSSGRGHWSDMPKRVARAAWEAADRAAREECAKICENMTEAYSIADDCADVIRSTITPASRQDDAQSAE